MSKLNFYYYSVDYEGYFIKTPWASNETAFTQIVQSFPSKAEAKIIFSIGAIKELFNPPFPKTVELTAADLSVHTFDTGYDFMLNEESGLETAQQLTTAIDANPLFTASLFVREDLYHRNHEKYNLDIEIIITQHLAGTDGNTEIKGTLFEDTWTPACGNAQQFPEVEFLTKTNFKGGGGLDSSTSVTTVIPGTDSCDSKTLIENGIAFDGSGTKINSGVFQDENEFMDFVSTCTNGYCDKDISTFKYESITPSATPLYLGAKQCEGVNGHGLFVLECFKADSDCGNIIVIGPGEGETVATGSIHFTMNNSYSGAYRNKTVELTDSSGVVHSFGMGDFNAGYTPGFGQAPYTLTAGGDYLVGLGYTATRSNHKLMNNLFLEICKVRQHLDLRVDPN